MPKFVKLPIDDVQLQAFARKLNALLVQKSWSQSDLARRMQELAPKGKTIGRHLASAYSRGAHRPTPANLDLIAKALGVKPSDLVPEEAGQSDTRRYATATTTLDGRTRLIVDVEVEFDIAQQVMEILRTAEPKKKKSAA